MKILAGPWIGEFGWELFCWQGYVRSLKSILNAEEVVAITRPGRELLYSDFAKVDTIKVAGNADMHQCRGFDIRSLIQKLNEKYPEYTIIPPFNARYYGNPISINIGGSKVVVDPKFVKLGDSPIEEYSVILHARSREHRSQDNWPQENWDKVGSYLSEKGISFACIGSLEESTLVRGAKDLRGLPISETVNYLAGAKITIGPSSGAIHLASLCGCSQLVWSGNAINKSRYETEWNPFEAEVVYLGSWNPSTENVIEEIEKILC